jgi:hypothetical protein
MKTTKIQRLVSVLERRWLTPLEAVHAVGLYSLSQRCGELRRSGLNVVSKWVKTPGGSRVKAYRVLGGKGC